jgi:hypothetical protein
MAALQAAWCGAVVIAQPEEGQDSRELGFLDWKYFESLAWTYRCSMREVRFPPQCSWGILSTITLEWRMLVVVDRNLETAYRSLLEGSCSPSLQKVTVCTKAINLLCVIGCCSMYIVRWRNTININKGQKAYEVIHRNKMNIDKITREEIMWISFYWVGIIKVFWTVQCDIHM